MRVADFIAKYIYDLGCEHVFCVTGAGIMHLTDGLACHEKLKAICLHNEQSVAMAVESYSRMREGVGVGYFTTGPGVTHAITGLAGAWQDSVASLYISGQVKAVEAASNSGVDGLRQFGVQELNIIPIVKPLCKYAAVVNEPSLILEELDKAIYFSKEGRPGPVWLDIPMDVQAAQIDADKVQSKIKFQQQERIEISSSKISEVAELFKKAQRPTIIAGRGVRLSGAIDLLKDFIVKQGVPAVTPFLAVDNFDESDSCYIGKLGIKGDRGSNLSVQNSDLVIAIGTSLHVSTIGYTYDHFAREAKKVVVDIDATSHKKKTIKIDHLVLSDAKVFLENLIRELDGFQRSDSSWLEKCRVWKEKYPVCIPEYDEQNSPLNIYSFVEALSARSSEGDVIISDAGSAYYAVSQGIKLKKNQRYIPSGAMATMGYSLPAAVGVACSVKKGEIVHAITGDGSLQQNIQELAVLSHLNLPVKLYVLNNNGYLSIRNSQKNYFDSRILGTDEESGVWMPDNKKIADVYNLDFVRIENLDDLDDSLIKVMSNDKPMLVEIMCMPFQQIIPSVSSKLNEDGQMESRPLEDMAPFLDRDEYLNNLYVKPV